LLDQARAALVSGDAGGALTVLDRHRRIFPDGRLAEERDVLRVRALLAAGRAKAAQAEAARFLRKHPASLFRPAVEQTIAETDSRAAPN
jgi:outer membrane protein assembly factor BamD (BamD/ComL family)